MDEILEAQLQRIETALNNLIDSIITYNPSIAASETLLQADEELSNGLEKLATHQKNYAKILSLRTETETLDSQIKTSVQTLADTRKELLAIPLPTPDTIDTIKPVPFDALLSYATKISPFTVPPSFRPAPPTATTTQDAPALENGTTPMEGVIAERQEDNGEKGLAYNQLTDEQKATLEDLNAFPFQPWPAEREMNDQNGALYNLNTKVNAGMDPTMVLERDLAAEAEALRLEEDSAKRRAAAAHAVAKGAAGGGVVQARAKAKFGLDDDDDEDEDD